MDKKLIILAERDILKYLNSIGVFPSEFFTDVDKFKAHAPMFEDTLVVIILSGLCNFSRKNISYLSNNLQERLEDKEDSGVAGLFVLSDTDLPLCSNYYKYADAPLSFLRYSGRKLISKESIDIWASLQYTRCDDTRLFLESTEFETAEKSIMEKKVGSDAGIESIKIPRWSFSEEVE